MFLDLCACVWARRASTFECRSPAHMHMSVPASHTHAHLGAGFWRTCTFMRLVPSVRMHPSEPVSGAHAHLGAWCPARMNTSAAVSGTHGHRHPGTRTLGHWRPAPKCACAQGDWRPSVHVRRRPLRKCACAQDTGRPIVHVRQGLARKCEWAQGTRRPSVYVRRTLAPKHGYVHRETGNEVCMRGGE